MMGFDLGSQTLDSDAQFNVICEMSHTSQHSTSAQTSSHDPEPSIFDELLSPNFHQSDLQLTHCLLPWQVRYRENPFHACGGGKCATE